MAGTSLSSCGPDVARRTRGIAAIAVAFVIASFGLTVSSAAAAPATSMVDLGDASTYAVLSGASVGNTVSAPDAPHTTLRGNLGVKANTQPTGFPPGVVVGVKHIGDTAASDAHADLVSAYTEVANRTDGSPLAGALAGATVGPGLHTIAGAVSNTTTLTLDGGGNPNAVFVFQVGGALAMAAGSHVVLTNGAKASRVFWQVNGAGAIGANADFAGTLMALDAVAVGNGTLVNGRALARNGALTLDANEIYSSPPAVTIDGGPTATTTDMTPTISGTTDVEAPGIVTVTINGETITAIPSDGGWSVESPLLANATYPIVASVTDGAGNPGSASQQLTVDTVLPVITIDGGPSMTTNDPTPTIAGTSDAAPGTTVHVAVGSQARTALVQAEGTWDVTATALSDGTPTVTASVADPAGNQGTDTQALTVDTTAPAVTIVGGATALTNDATPAISGTAGVAPGTTVSVDLADATLTTQVQDGGDWSVTAPALSDGPHRIVMSVSDTAGNRAGLTQWLTVDTLSPLVAIDGGGTATTSDGAPTITGTSNAAPGTTVTISIGGQTMTTLLQADGTWNATPTFVGDGTWQIVATAPDPAGNVGSAEQALTIGATSGGTPPPVFVPPVAPFMAPPSSSTAPFMAPPSSTTAPFMAPPSSSTALTAAAAEAAVARSGSRKLKRKARWIGTKVTAPVVGRVIATATGTVKIQGVKKAIRLKRVTRTVAAGRSATLRLKPKGTKRAAAAAFAKIERAVKQGKKVTATIRVKLVDANGNARKVQRTLKLT